jgi:cytochrome c-type biogenesis protein
MDTLWVAFTLGVGSAASPCLLPLYPSFLAYLSANAARLQGRGASGWLGLIILLGVLTTMTAIGLGLVALSVSMGSLLGYLIPLVDGALIVLGILLLVGRNPFERLPGARVPIVANPYGQAYLYGIMLGPLALPCAGAFIVALLALSAGITDAAPRLLTFFVYGLGFGLPLVLLSLLAGANQRAVVGFVTRHHRAIEIVGGALLVGVGVWDLAVNWENLRVTFGF